MIKLRPLGPTAQSLEALHLVSKNLVCDRRGYSDGWYTFTFRILELGEGIEAFVVCKTS